MNNPNPLLPQGSLSGQSKGKSNFRVAVFTILAIHVVLICGFLIFGCKPDPVQTETTNVEPTNFSPSETFEQFGGTGTSTTNPFPDDPTSIPPYDPQTNAGNIVNGTTGVTGVAPGGIPQASQPTNYAPYVPSDPVPPVVIPTPSRDTTIHVVASGDTLSTIAPKYNVTVRAIEEANPGVNPTRLQIGQKLNIPASSASVATAPSATASSGIANGDFIIYTVKSGDVLERIARNHNTTVAAIKAANGMRTDRINAGQKLKIPKK